MQLLARSEGIYAEPTGASPIAALPRLWAEGHLPADARIVCMVTGHGFKDGKVYQDLPVHTHRVDDPTDTAAVVRICDAALGMS
jgi:threonine synthase